MNRFFRGALVLGAFVASVCGCLQSPLLNHADADQPSPMTANPSAGCAFKFEKSGLCASLTWQVTPTEDDEGEAVIRFWNSTSGSESGPYVDPQQTVFVKLWMPSMGHGSSKVTVASERDSGGQNVVGVYRATHVNFVMSGVWEIWVQLKRGNDVIDQAKIDYRI